MKQYKIGFYGGKFIPFHLGHWLCASKMSYECEKGYLILFAGGDQELEILKNNKDPMLLLENRWKTVQLMASKLSNVAPILIDVTDVKLPDGTEDWDGETPLVRAVCGNQIDAVYSSEYSYDDYFKRAYSEATHVLVDPPRNIVPISATMIRNMTDNKEKEKWMV